MECHHIFVESSSFMEKKKKEYKENHQFLDIDSYPRGKIYIIWEEEIHKPILAVKEMVTNCQNMFHDCVIIYWWAFYCLYLNQEHTHLEGRNILLNAYTICQQRIILVLHTKINWVSIIWNVLMVNIFLNIKKKRRKK